MTLDKKTANLIKNLNSLSKKQLKYILNLIDDETLEIFREIFLNLNFNTLEIKNEASKKLFDQMKKNKKVCEEIASRKTHPKMRRRLLKRQTGSGLLTLAISVLAPVVANLIANAVAKKK